MPGKPGKPQRITKLHNGEDSKRWAIVTPAGLVRNIIVANQLWVDTCLNRPGHPKLTGLRAIEIGRMPGIAMGWTYGPDPERPGVIKFSPPAVLSVSVGPEGMGKTELLARAADDGFVVVPS